MMKTIKTVGKVAIISIMLLSAYYIGTTQSKTEVIEKEVEYIPNGYIDSASDSFYENYIDVRTITDFSTSEDGLMIHFENGTGYYWGR